DEARVRVEALVLGRCGPRQPLHVVDAVGDADGLERGGIRRIRGVGEACPEREGRDCRANHDAMPRLPSTPASFGRFSDGAAMLLRSRRYRATTSQIGSPVAPSATGAQPATLYALAASIGFPARRMSLMRSPMRAPGVHVYVRPPTLTMSPPCW